MKTIFNPEDENKIKGTFSFYSNEELKDFIAHSFVDRILLTLSLNEHDLKDAQREIMLGVLERLQIQAIVELKRRRVQE